VRHVMRLLRRHYGKLALPGESLERFARYSLGGRSGRPEPAPSAVPKQR
jgi:hypothetical protein